MRKMWWLLLLIGLPLWAQGEGEEILLGARLKLGMAQDQVLKEVGKYYAYKVLSDPSQYVVFTPPKEQVEKPRWEGMLTFKATKLVSVERLWAYESDENSVALTKSLVGVLSNFVRDGQSTCVVQTMRSDAPDAEGETVFVNCGKRSLKISVTKIEGYKEDASVSEMLEQ